MKCVRSRVWTAITLCAGMAEPNNVPWRNAVAQREHKPQCLSLSRWVRTLNLICGGSVSAKYQRGDMCPFLLIKDPMHRCIRHHLWGFHCAWREACQKGIAVAAASDNQPLTCLPNGRDSYFLPLKSCFETTQLETSKKIQFENGILNPEAKSASSVKLSLQQQLTRSTVGGKKWEACACIWIKHFPVVDL